MLDPGRVSILVVDDDSDLRESLAEVLTDAGYDVIAAANGEEALARLRAMPSPQLVLLDLMMPVMDGWQFRAAQMRDPQLARIPVIIFSAAGNLHERASNLRPAAFLAKPVVLDKLLDTIARHAAAL